MGLNSQYGYVSDIRVVGLESVAQATVNSFVHDSHDAKRQLPPDNFKTCPWDRQPQAVYL